MGWIGKKWFPEWRGDYCQGFYELPEDGSAPIWEYKDPEFEGTQDHRPIWVMVNGREIPHRLVYRKAGGADCKIVSGETPQPNGWGFPSTKYFCSSHMLWLADEDEVLEHFGGNKGTFGQWAKEQGIKSKKETAPKEKIEVEMSLAAEIKAFLEPILAANAKFVELWRIGKTGPLVGAAMREAKGKYEGKHIEAVLEEILNGRPL